MKNHCMASRNKPLPGRLMWLALVASLAATLCVSAEIDEIAEMREETMALFYRGEFARGRVSARDFLDAYPDSAVAPEIALKLAVTEPSYEASQQQLLEFLAKYPGVLRDEAHFAIGENYFLKGDFETGEWYYHKVAGESPESPLAPDSAIKTALCFFGQKRHDDARDALWSFLRANPLHPGRPRLLYKIAESLLDDDEDESAAEILALLARDFGDRREGRRAMLDMAELFMEIGDIEAARNEYEAVIRFYPNTEEADTAAERLKRL